MPNQRLIRTRQAKDSEFRAYAWIKSNLDLLGWDTRNPERAPAGQVWTQTEVTYNAELKRFLGLRHPENIVKVSDRVLWIIEAKASHGQLEEALNEARSRADTLRPSKRFDPRFITGVAGNDMDSYLARTQFWNGSSYVTVSLNDIATTGLLSPDITDAILQHNNPELADPTIDERLFLARAEHINAILHKGAVNPHQRAGVMASLLLAELSSTSPNVEERDPTTLIMDINNRAHAILRQQHKESFYEYIRINLPSTPDNHTKLRHALVDTIQELHNLNVRSAMNSGSDWLGAFYEVFLKYARWARDLGIVLTPRHITRYVADVMDINPHDIVYDPTCGTAGFLVAAFDHVKQRSHPDQVSLFKQHSVFGIEQDAGVAALAVVNMIFRGDGKNNIQEGNCFSKTLEADRSGVVPTARYVTGPTMDPPISKVMMNPPFSLQNSTEKEYKFIDQALAQMEYGGLLFSILPYAAMVKPGAYKTWRQNVLLPQNTLEAVVTLPPDLFYPVGVTTVGIFVRKGIPHKPDRKVLWIRAVTDGLLKRKGKRLPHHRSSNDLERARSTLKAFLGNPSFAVENIERIQKACSIDHEDDKYELVPEYYLDQPLPQPNEIQDGIDRIIRGAVAFLIKEAKLSTTAFDAFSMAERSEKSTAHARTGKWERFSVTDLFDIAKGDFHSLAALDPGSLMTVSRVVTDNGVTGYYERPDDASVYPAGTITVSTLGGDAFVQMDEFIATDNVLILTPRASMPMGVRFFAALMLNQQTWRYSYGRQCYLKKFHAVQLWLPVADDGRLDEEYMRAFVENSEYWQVITGQFEDHKDLPL